MEVTSDLRKEFELITADAAASPAGQSACSPPHRPARRTRTSGGSAYPLRGAQAARNFLFVSSRRRRLQRFRPTPGHSSPPRNTPPPPPLSTVCEDGTVYGWRNHMAPRPQNWELLMWPSFTWRCAGSAPSPLTYRYPLPAPSSSVTPIPFAALLLPLYRKPSPFRRVPWFPKIFPLPFECPHAYYSLCG